MREIKTITYWDWDNIQPSFMLPDIAHGQAILIALVFVWAGFVRTGLGFGGAALGLPLMLFIHNDPRL
jgi:uncharacterized protein